MEFALVFLKPEVEENSLYFCVRPNERGSSMDERWRAYIWLAPEIKEWTLCWLGRCRRNWSKGSRIEKYYLNTYNWYVSIPIITGIIGCWSLTFLLLKSGTSMDPTPILLFSSVLFRFVCVSFEHPRHVFYNVSMALVLFFFLYGFLLLLLLCIITLPFRLRFVYMYYS